MIENSNITPDKNNKNDSQDCQCGRQNGLPIIQQMPTNQNPQNYPIQNMPLYYQQPIMRNGMQPIMQPMQQQSMLQQPMQQQVPFTQRVSMPTPSTVGELPVVRFTDYEQLSMLTEGVPITAESLQYLNGFLRTQIGRRVRVDFLLGTNSFIDREGILLGVGVNYILINETDTDDITACDFYNIKFIKFYY